MAGEATRAAILDAAERVFANHGFDGATVRCIAEAAAVNQGLIHYHFDSKERLYAEVFARRATDINERRTERLEWLFAEARPGVPSLEKVIEALLRPTIELGRDPARGGRHYAKLLAAAANATDLRSIRLIRRQYDGIATQFIDAIRRVLPGIGRADAVWGYLSAIGIAIPLMARTGRAAELSDGICDDEDVASVLDRTVVFICAGLRALAHTTETDLRMYPQEAI